MQTKGFEESYGLDNLRLTVAKAYLVKLLATSGSSVAWRRTSPNL
jgi:hypothetical protein